MKKLHYLLISLICLSGFSYAREYKTSSAVEIKNALKKVVPGDTIIMRNGIWKDQHIKFEAMGTENLPVYLKAETPGKVMLTGSSKLRIGGEFLIVDGLYFIDGSITDGSVIEFRDSEDIGSRHCRVTNSAIVNYNPPEKNTEYKWVSLYGEYNRVDKCWFRNKTNAGCLVVVWLSDIPNYHLIDSNYFAYRPELGENGAEIIRIGTSHWSMYPSYTTVENNYFEECSGEREIISNKSFYNIYRSNTFVRCQGTLTLRHGNCCTVEGNFFFGDNIPMTGGVRIIGEGHKVVNNYFQDLAGEDVFSALPMMNGVPDSPLNRYFQVKDALVAFNTFVNCRNNIVIGTGADAELSLSPQNSVIANNVFWRSSGSAVTFLSSPENFKWEGNVYYAMDAGIEVEGLKKYDPELMLSVEKLWRPGPYSPLIDNAMGSYDIVKTDIDGQLRIGPKDVGCDEVSGKPIIKKPLKANDVGPEWKK